MGIPFRHQPPPAWLLPWLHHMLSLGRYEFRPTEMVGPFVLGMKTMKTHEKTRFWMVRIRWVFLDTTMSSLNLGWKMVVTKDDS